MAAIYRRPVSRGVRKEREVIEIHTTPNDELSSWLPDDGCTNCGSTTPRGKLFCSEECKLADARQVGQEANTDMTAPVFNSFQDSDEKFRYACPPSPSLLATMSPLSRPTHLTSPALAAYQSSLPPPRLRSHGRADASGMPKKRSGSHSTFSSVSESNGSAHVSTDISTPSPAHHAIDDESSDLDTLDFQLPPSVSSASAVMLRRASKPRSPTSVVQRPNEACTPKSPLWYARRPSTTNAPGTFYTSPAISATSKVTATNQDTGSSDSSHGGSWYSRRLARRAATELLSAALGSPAAAGSPASLVERKSPVQRRNLSQDAGTRSPQAVHSVASSAGRTMLAPSPPGSRAFSPLNVDACDRCRTLSNISGELDIYASSFVSSQSRGRSISSRDGDERSRGRTQSHKHSHSAAAALLFTQVYERESKPETTEVSSNPAELVRELRATPPRGRSKARGRSSQRRSPSPPRAAARRESSAVLDLSPAPVSPRSHPISISNRSPRLSGDKDALHAEQELRSKASSALKAATEVTEDRGRERGRSSRRDRNAHERGSTSRSRNRWVDHSCELSWPAYGHRDSDRGEINPADAVRQRRSGPRSKAFADPGFDDVDLELDDEASSIGSAESAPTRGRATLRT